MLLLLAKATTTALLSLLLFFKRLLVHIFSLSSEIIVQRARKMRALNTKTRQKLYKTNKLLLTG